MQLTDIVIKNLTQAGRYTDNNTKGLHLWVKSANQKYWVLRYTINGKRNAVSLGAYPDISLKLARERAIEVRNSINKGQCPANDRKAAKKIVLGPCTKALTFKAFALQHIQANRPKWRNPKHAAQWVSTVTTYAFPIIGDLPLDEIDTEHIVKVLNPIWYSKAETASRVRGRIERILSAAITLKHRPTNNPAVWKGHLENILPIARPTNKHHEALPYKQIPEFMAKLHDLDSLSALALEFTILNASRTNEVLQATRAEVEGDVWTIPAERMKAGKKHQVPLCPRSLQILEIAKSNDPESSYLFSNNGKHLCNMAMLVLARRLSNGITVHGFRSSFRDWVSEETDHSPEVAEMALAHTIGNKVEQAYRRGKLLERRRLLMQDWAAYCLTGKWGNVVQLFSSKTA